MQGLNDEDSRSEILFSSYIEGFEAMSVNPM